MKETLLFSVPIPLVPLFLLVSCGGDVTGPPDPGNDPTSPLSRIQMRVSRLLIERLRFLECPSTRTLM